MLSVAFATLRVRWVSFVGTFVALAFGVGLMATAIPVIAATGSVVDSARQRWSEAPVVVVPNSTIDVVGTSGQAQSTALPQQPGLSPQLVAAVAATGRVVEDHSFYAQLQGGPKDQVGRGWSAHEAGGYRLAAGRPPAAEDELVVGGGDAALIGKQLRLTTGTGPRTATVTGVTGEVPFEHALFFADATAARLSPAVDALAAYGPAEEVRKAVAAAGGARVSVLTGSERAAADPHTSSCWPRWTAWTPRSVWRPAWPVLSRSSSSPGPSRCRSRSAAGSWPCCGWSDRPGASCAA
ncbi:hypothetical protein [Streptomyces sp. NPDC047014]|uniref:hypothetical protein n=1 Tax=Streptomyces sp. NPDC047014 TaxID=3155736 RepID=UPI0033F405A1